MVNNRLRSFHFGNIALQKKRQIFVQRFLKKVIARKYS